MKFLNTLLSWVLYTSVFAALCSLSLCMATERLLIGTIPPLFTSLHVLVFGSTLVVYNTHHIIKKSTPLISDRFNWSQRYKHWNYIFCGIGLAMCICSLFWLSGRMFLACVVLGILSFAYSVPMLPFRDKRRIRDFGWIKILVLTSVWTIVTSMLPIVYWDKDLYDYPYEILMRFVFMLTLCVAFDIRDMQTDLEAGIFTIPNLIGLKNSYRLMNAAILLFSTLSIIQYFRYQSVSRLIADLVTALMTKIVIDYSRKYPSDKAYLGLVDGMMLLYGILVLSLNV